MTASFSTRKPTRDKRWLVFFCLVILSLSVSAQTTLYTYQSGSWDNIDVWTTDPGGTTLVGSKVPGNGDAIVVLPSRTLTLAANIVNTGLGVTILPGGTFDASSFSFTSPLASLSGQGTYRLSSANFPSAGTNTFTGAAGGTVEYYNSANFTLAAAQTSYYNLAINCAGFTATQLNNLAINGNLTVLSGTFRINDGTNTRRTLVINGDLNVNAGAYITVGTGNTSTTTDPKAVAEGGSAPFINYYAAQSHRIEIYGNLTINGSVRFTNQDYPVYNLFPSNGFATVFFRGAADNEIVCNGTTDFYNLVVDKGTDQTFVLTINSAGYDKFRLFGANNVAQYLAGAEEANPNIRKSLWIRNGTLKLNGRTFLPSLTEGGGDFIIPGNGALVVNGPDVVVMGTIDSYSPVTLAYGVTGLPGLNGVTTGSLSPSGISLYGRLQVNEGKLYIGEYGRIVYYGSSASAQFIINGGIIDVKQFQSVIGGGKTAYWQTGGALVLRGRFQRSLLYTSLSNLISSIGDPAQLNNIRVPGPDPGSGTLNIDQPENIFHMEGGSIDIFDVTGTTAPCNAIEINSDPSNISVTGGNISINITSGSVPAQDINYGIKSTAALFNTSITRKSGSSKAVLTGTFATLNNLTLANTSGVAGQVLDAAGYNLKVGGNFLIQNNAEYTPGSNRTIFNGAGAQNFTNQGSITSGLNKFIVDKNSGVLTLGSAFTVRDSLAILSGGLNDGGYTLLVAGNIYNNGTHTGTGLIILNGATVQNISSGGSAIFGNIELRNASVPVGAQLNCDVSVNNLILTANTGGRSILDIGSYGLSINGGITSSGTLAFGASKMIRTNGLSSDKGLKRYITNAYNGATVLFPVGCNGGDLRTAVDFFPGRLTLGSVSTNGYFTVVPISGYHPSCTSKGDALDFYWKTKVGGLVTSAASRLEFDYWTDINNKYNGPYYLLLGASIWATGTTINNSPTIRFDGLGAPVGDFSAGQKNPFKGPTTYYSRQSGGFNVRATWSTDPVLKHTGSASTSDPQPYDMIVIGGQSGALTAPRTSANDSITVTAAINVSSITINGSYTGNLRTPVLNIRSITGHTIDIIRGDGKFCSSTENIPVSDYGEMVNSETAIFQFFDGPFTLPTALSTYPNLLLTGNSTKTLRNGSTVIRKDLMISDNLVSANILQLNPTAGNLTVHGNVRFKNGGKLVIPVTSSSRTIDIYGNIDFKYGNTSNANSIEASAVAGTGTVHKINFYGKSIISGASNLSLNQSATNKADLYLKGPGNVNISYGSGTFSLNKLIIQKDVVADTVFFRNNFTLNESGNSSAAKSLTLGTGTLILSDPSNGSASAINLNLSNGGTDCFILNSSSSLILRNGSKINITGITAGSGIRLDGLLKAEGASEINLANGTNTGYIEYTGSGNAAIILNGASVLKADQVRRSLSLSTGLLNYTQSGTSAATIYGAGASATRAKFEVTGIGSSFNMSGTSTLSIVNGGGAAFGDLYLRPGTSAVTGGSIILGTGVSARVYKVDASVPLNNITLNATGASNEIQLMVNPLNLQGNLTLANANCRFTANSLDVAVGGNFINNGTYIAGNNTTTFNGSTQTISGANDPLFNNLLISPSVKVILLRSITAGSELNITSGILETGNFDVTVRGNVTNNGTYTNDPAGTSKLYLNGTAVQTISGSGSFGRIELDNATGGAKLANNLALSEDLTLKNGVLDINQYSLTLGSQSDIPPAAFGTGRMIKSDGVFSNGGIIKHFNAGSTGTFVYPAGVSGKYTPASLVINATNSGWVRLNVINSKHPATLSPFNVLGYYWEAESSITGFEGNLTLKYEAADVAGTESQYVAGRLIIPPGTGWSKAAAGASTDNVNEAAHTIYFNFPTGTTNLGGQYTAGQTSDLPNTIPVYTSNTLLGNWNDPASWLPAPPAGGPDGVVVIIRPGDVINTNGNKRFAFRTTVNGTLVTGTSYGHNLGTVNGTGTISLSQANLPAGNFREFLGCSGGTLEYDGGSYTIIADRIDTVKNVIFKGTGTKTLPDKDLVVCNRLEINGPVLDNHFNRKLSVGGSLILTSGSFLSGAGAGATVTFNGTAPQTISGFRSANPLNNLEINNATGLTLNSAIMMKGNLIMTNGVINTTADSLLKMTGQTATSTSGNSSSFVNGPMSKNQLGGNDFTFPLGKAGRHGKLGLVNPQSGIWEAEYYNSPYPNATTPDVSVAGTLVKASTAEYWRINSPANGKTATVKLRWDNLSDISPLTTSGGINDIRVAEYDGADWREKASAVPVGTDNDGTVQTSANIAVNNAGHPRFYTLGSATSVKPAIILGIPAPVCRCVTSAPLPYLSVTGGANQYTIDWNAAANTALFVDISAWTSLPSSPISLAVPSSAAPGVYTGLIRVRDGGSPANISIPYSFSIIILPDISWTGSAGTDWNSTANWSCPFLPDATITAVIPVVTNKPVISAGWTGSVNNLTVNAGTTLTISGTLRIAGTITNNGTITATSGGIELNGTAAQVIPSGLFSGNRIKNLTLNNAAGAVLQGPLGVSGIVKVQIGNLASNGNLTLLSDAAGTALIDGSGSGNVTGNVTMQRYLSSRFGYKYISSPFQNATVNELANEIDLAYWFPLVYRYDENRNYMGTFFDPFVGYADPVIPLVPNPLVPMEGYAVNFGAVSTPITIDMKGVVNNSSYSTTVTNHNNPWAMGLVLLGNPYPSPIDWALASGWTKTHVDNALYYFKASDTDEWGGTYSSWVNGTSSDLVASNIIPSMQGFMVRVNTLSPVDGVVGMDNSVRVVNMTQPFIKGAAMAEEKSLVRLSASITSSSPFEDPLVIYFDENASGNFDSDFDAIKYFNTDWMVPNFFSFGNDGSKLSINALPLPDGHVPVIPLGYKALVDGDVVFKLKNIEGPYSWGTIDLYDVETGESHDLSSGSEYKVFLPAGDYFDRFFLNFKGFATGSFGQETDYEPFLVYSFKGTVHAEINCLSGKEGTLTISNLTGQAVYNMKVYANGPYEFDPAVKDGVYIVSFVSGKFRTSEKIFIKGR